MKKEFFGTLKNGDSVYKYTVDNGTLSLSVMDRGATVVSLKYHGRDIILGFDSLSDYELDFLCHGAIIGRVADRIEDACFQIDGKTYNVTKNNGEHCLHSGNCFNRRLWSLHSAEENKMTFFYSSPDKDEGFPGRLDVYVSFIIDGSDFIIDYCAQPFDKTPISLTNHSYFNLDGADSLILSHIAKLHADTYLEINERMITTGRRLSAKGSVFDFENPKRIGEEIEKGFSGYDNYYLISGKEKRSFSGKELTLAAEIFGTDTKMSVYTDQKGFLFYTGNYLKGPDFKGGIPQRNYAGLCIETGDEPNAVKRGKIIYNKGDIYTHTVVYSLERLGNEI